MLITAALCAGLGAAIWDMNFWPTDTEAFYLPAAQKLPALQYISQMHEGFDDDTVKWLHGKEMLILVVSCVQRVMQDTESLRPFIVVCLAAAGLSAILIFVTARRLWGETAAIVCWFLFATSFWPYLYVLFTKHQPVGLFFFLLAVFLLLVNVSRHGQAVFLKNGQSAVWNFFSGLAMGCALFSSTVAPVYIPFYVTAFFYCQNRMKNCSLGNLGTNGGLVCLGAGTIVIYLTYPNIFYNIQSLFDYVNLSSAHNHFFYNQPVLQQWIPESIPSARGGLAWVFEYFLIVTPVVFPLYIAGAGYLLKKIWEKRAVDRRGILLILGAIVLSCAPVGLAEIRRVAQYGANYFPAMIGMIFLIGCALSTALKEENLKAISPARLLLLKSAAGAAIIFHAAINLYLFLSDVYPTRMATAFLSRKIESMGIDHLYTYKEHPHSLFFAGQITPALKEKLRFVPIETIDQPKEGYILVPPVTKDSIYLAMQSDYTNFDQDIFLNELVLRQKLDEYAAAAYKTLVSSLIWSLEEEVLSYRYLTLNQFSPEKAYLGKVWLLDAAKIHQARVKNVPSADYIHLARDNVRNIGTKEKVYMYKGYRGFVSEPSQLRQFAARIYKVGNPMDSLVAYAYKVDHQYSVLVPHGRENQSRPLEASRITGNPDGGLAIFEFPEPLEQEAGYYLVKIYRTGAPDDRSYYRVYVDFQK